MDTLSYKTVSAKNEGIERRWYIIDATNMVVGRLCSEVAKILRGKHKTCYTPHIDCGDNVIIINAEKVRFTGKKLMQKEYIWYSGYPGGQKSVIARDLIQRNPIKVIEHAIKGMLPKNRLGRAMFRKLHVYAGSEHPHKAQQPIEYKISE